MTAKTLWQNLKLLVDCDRNIIQTEMTIKDTVSGIEKNKQQIDHLIASREAKKNLYAQERKNVALLELQATEFKTDEDEKKRKLNSIKDQRELRAIEKELEVINQKQLKHEDALVQSWQSMEHAQKSLEQETITSELKITALQEEINAQNESIQKTREALEQLDKDRAQAAINIPEEWLVKYNRMKYSMQDPIVPVHETSCSSCFYTIIKQDYANLKKVGMLPCRNCYRLLYIDTDTNTGTDTEKETQEKQPGI